MGQSWQLRWQRCVKNSNVTDNTQHHIIKESKRATAWIQGKHTQTLFVVRTRDKGPQGFVLNINCLVYLSALQFLLLWLEAKICLWLNKHNRWSEGRFHMCASHTQAKKSPLQQTAYVFSGRTHTGPGCLEQCPSTIVPLPPTPPLVWAHIFLILVN